MRAPTSPTFLASLFHGFWNSGVLVRGSEYVRYSVANEVRPTSFQEQDGASINVSVENMFPPLQPPVGGNVGFEGNFTIDRPANGGVRTMAACGYLYSGNAKAADVLDYYVEKETPYTKRDRFLSPPFSDADLFSVSGEGIGGGFRLYDVNPGQFRPNLASSRTMIANLELQPHLGPLHIGLGGGFGAGCRLLRVGAWCDDDPRFTFLHDSRRDEPVFFRMDGDAGGHLLHSADTNAVSASLQTDCGIWGFERHSPRTAADRVFEVNGGQRPGRAIYIGYSLASNVGRGGPEFDLFDRSCRSLEEPRIAEFGLTNARGYGYVYGLAVLNRKEKHIQYGLAGFSPRPQVIGNEAVYAHATASSASIVVGEESDPAYAGTYLLTGITTPDYIDRNLDGMSSDDFGGYTSFSYVQTAGDNVDYASLNVEPPSSPGEGTLSIRRRPASPMRSLLTRWASRMQDDASGWYKWRVPYRGLSFKRGMLSDMKDDMGAFSMGEREVFYLKTIETKSHVAVFVTNAGTYTHGRLFRGSGVHRRDGYEAPHNEHDISGNESATRAAMNGVQQPNQLRRLERIELWAKDQEGDLSQLLQTTHFDYDYSLCQGLPNAFNGSGKLTLRRIWFEYNGVKNAGIQPYEFDYVYPSAASYGILPAEIQTKYSAITHFGDQWAGTAQNQNPDYSMYQVGRWGNYQPDGQVRHERMIPWVEQNPPSTFDPAAWQLKNIRLPSGGEIHIQYEQHQYGYVQDRIAEVMVPLAGGDLNQNRYTLDMDAAFDGLGTAEKLAFAEAMHSAFVANGERMFFRVLHSLVSDQSPSLSRTDAEYMTGYAPVASVGVEDGQVAVYFTDDGHSTPTDLALDFIEKNRLGVFTNPAYSYHTGKDANQTALSQVTELWSRIRQFFSIAGLESSWRLQTSHPIDWANSYVRIPLGKPGHLIRAKNADGARVRRVLMFDPGIEADGGQLFGTEYLYQNEDGSTSGVAANEPGDGREENALVRPLEKREDQGWVSKLVAGEDLDQFEGPLGESLLPSPSIIYGRVVSRNIHSGSTSPGFTVQEYYTPRDFPFSCFYDKNDLRPERITPVSRETDLMNVPVPYVTFNRANIWAAQGYRFVLNNVVGQMKRTATYGGEYDANQEEWIESSAQEMEYYRPGEPIPMLYDYTSDPEYRLENPGTETEVIAEGREIADETISASGHVDVNVLLFLPIVLVFPTLSGSLAYSDATLRTHTTTKIIRYPAILKEVRARQDGIQSVTTNIGFNPLTGEAIATRTSDGFAGMALQRANGQENPSGTEVHNRSYKTFSYPAALEYSGMGQKAYNERAVIRSEEGGLQVNKCFDGVHYLSFRYGDPSLLCKPAAYLSTGDLVEVTVPAPEGVLDIGVYHVDRIIGSRVVIVPHSRSAPTLVKDNVTVRVIRSGRTNQLSTARGGITVYTEDEAP